MQAWLFGVIGLLAGIILTKSFGLDGQSNNYSVDDPNPTPLEVEQVAPITTSADSTLANLQKMLAEEREKNTLLANQIADLRTVVPTRVDSEQQEQRELAQEDRSERTERRANLPDADELIEAGLSVYEANRVVELRQEAQQKLQSLLEDPENRDRETLAQAREEFTEQMISELGTYGYESYLEATGQPTSVPVTEVAPDSAGALAGIVEGDEIVSYNGERVYDIQTLRSLTSQGAEGETVSVEVLRDGSTVSMTLPTGTIGVTTERARSNIATGRPGRR